MNLENWPFFVILLGIMFSAELVAFRHKKYSERELLEISTKYYGIKWKYWGWTVIIIPLMLLTIYGGFALADRFPSFEMSLSLFSFSLAISYISVYKSIFALFTNVYPVEKNDGFVIGEKESIRALALRGIVLVILLLVLAFVYGIAYSAAKTALLVQFTPV
jgi:hypothetical protein